MADRRPIATTQSISSYESVSDAGTPSGGAPKYGTFFLGRYRVVDEIGIGGMASVHLARADGPGGFQKWAAIKRIHPHLVEDDQFVHMFLDEARIAARISHPNVSQVFELGEGDGTYWIAMEYLHGEPLREVIRCMEDGAQRISVEVAAKIIADAAEGLHAAHDLRGGNGELLGLVHRDVTPHNLFITYEGTVKVVDFGIAKVAGRLSSTRAGTLKGKLAYMSPEQVRGVQELDRRTDIFALGVVLWELTTGHRLFRMDSDLETLEKVQNCIVPSPSSIIRSYPPELESVVMKALAKAPEARYQTARDLSRALQQYLMRRGVFVGPEDVSAYMRSIFGERIKKRDAHLRWAAEVTQTVDASGDLVEEQPDEIDENEATFASEVQPARSGMRPVGPGFPGVPQVTGRGPTRPSDPPPSMRGPGMPAMSPRPAAGAPPSGPLPPPRPAAGAPPPTNLASTVPGIPAAGRGFGAPAPAGPSPLPTFNSAPGIAFAPRMPHARPDEFDDDENVATIVGPSMRLLEGAEWPPSTRPSSSQQVSVAPSLTPTGPAQHHQMGYQQQPVPGFPPPMMGAYGPPPVPGAGAALPQAYVQTQMVSGRQADPTQQIAALRDRDGGSKKPMIILGIAALLFVVVTLGAAVLIVLRFRAPPPAEPVPTHLGDPSQPNAVPVDPRPASTPAAPPTPPSTASAIDPSSLPPSAPPTSTTPPASTGGGPAPNSTGAKVGPPPDPPKKDDGGTGYLTVVCTPFCDSVTVKGRGLGPSPVLKVPFPAGTYMVSLRKNGSASKSIPATIQAGQTTPLRVKMD